MFSLACVPTFFVLKCITVTYVEFHRQSRKADKVRNIMTELSLASGLIAVSGGLLAFAAILAALEGIFAKSQLEVALAAAGVALCGGYAWWVGATLFKVQRVGLSGIDNPGEVAFAITAAGLLALLLATPLVDVASRRGALLAAFAVTLLNFGFDVVVARTPLEPQTVHTPAAQDVSTTVALGELGRDARRAQQAREDRSKPTHGVFVKRSGESWLIREAPQLPGEGWRLVLFSSG